MRRIEGGLGLLSSVANDCQDRLLRPPGFSGLRPKACAVNVRIRSHETSNGSRSAPTLRSTASPWMSGQSALSAPAPHISCR
jgi:hypothetical protein